MKRIFLLLIPLLFLNTLMSQQRFYSSKSYGLELQPDYNSVYELKLGYKPDSLLCARGIRNASIYSQTTRRDKPGKTVEQDSMYFSFDEHGFLLEQHFLKNKRGHGWNKEYMRVYTRSADGKPNSMLWQPGDKPWIKTSYYRNSRGNMDSTVTIDEGNDLPRNKTLYRYNDSGKLLSRVTFDKNREVMRWEQEFFPDGSLSVFSQRETEARGILYLQSTGRGNSKKHSPGLSQQGSASRWQAAGNLEFRRREKTSEEYLLLRSGEPHPLYRILEQYGTPLLFRFLHLFRRHHAGAQSQPRLYAQKQRQSGNHQHPVVAGAETGLHGNVAIPQRPCSIA
jgi:antitoxin component YwqK of YwqJK toxin-antitoxin module